MNVIFILGAVQSFFLALLLFNKKQRDRSDLWLAYWLMICGLHIFLYYLESLSVSNSFSNPHLLSVSSPLTVVHGPFIYFYIHSLIRIRKITFLEYVLHFIPFLLILVYLSFFIYFQSAEQKIEIFKNLSTNGLPWHVYLFWPMVLLSGPVYISLSIVALKKHKKNVYSLFSYTESVDLHWLKLVLVGVGIVFLSIIVFEILSDVLHVLDEFSSGNYIFLAASLFIFVIGYFGIKQTSVFRSEQLALVSREIADNKAIGPKTDKYKKSGLKQEEIPIYFTTIQKLIQDKELFLNEKLCIADLANELGLNINYVSQVINQESGMNFFDFINAHRIRRFIDEVQKNENRNLTFLAIATDCGFNSKSSFNRAFKKNTGITPSEFFAQRA